MVDLSGADLECAGLIGARTYPRRSGANQDAAIALCVDGMSRHNADERLRQ